MKSFRLHIESRRELAHAVIGALIGVGVFLAAQYFGLSDSSLRLVLLLLVAISVSYSWHGYSCRRLRRQYPNARCIPLLAVGLMLCMFGFIAHFLVPRAEVDWFTPAFLLPAVACIAAFVIVNRRDPDVTK